MSRNGKLEVIKNCYDTLQKGQTMRFFYYVHTGHRIGLDRFRRAATIIRALGDIDVTVLTSDYRIASVARDFGIKRCVGIDVVRNIPQIAHHGDKIIFDSDEINPIMLDELTRFFSHFVRVNDDESTQKHPDEYLVNPYIKAENTCNALAIDEKYFQVKPKIIKRALFFGDDDYEEDLLKNKAMFDELDLELQLGFYFFIGYEDKMGNTFTKFHEFEDYDDVIQKSEVLVTCSPQAVLENLASQGRPVFIQRPDYGREFLPLFNALNVPIIEGYNKEILSNILDKVLSHKYKTLEQNNAELTKFLKISLDL